MNQFYCMSLGAFMFAAVCRHKDDWTWCLIWFTFANITAFLGGMIK